MHARGPCAYHSIAAAVVGIIPDRATIPASLLLNKKKNSFVQDALNSYCATHAIVDEQLRYGDMIGREDLRGLICGVLQRNSMAGITVTPENMVLGSGTSAIINAVTALLADPGCSVLTPAPYYPMFNQDVFICNNVRCRPVYLESSHDTDATVLDAAKRAAESDRQPPRMLLISNPDNPTGETRHF